MDLKEYVIDRRKQKEEIIKLFQKVIEMNLDDKESKKIQEACRKYVEMNKVTKEEKEYIERNLTYQFSFDWLKKMQSPISASILHENEKIQFRDNPFKLYLLEYFYANAINFEAYYTDVDGELVRVKEYDFSATLKYFEKSNVFKVIDIIDCKIKERLSSIKFEFIHDYAIIRLIYKIKDIDSGMIKTVKHAESTNNLLEDVYNKLPSLSFAPWDKIFDKNFIYFSLTANKSTDIESDDESFKMFTEIVEKQNFHFQICTPNIRPGIDSFKLVFHQKLEIEGQEAPVYKGVNIQEFLLKFDEDDYTRYKEKPAFNTDGVGIRFILERACIDMQDILPKKYQEPVLYNIARYFNIDGCISFIDTETTCLEIRVSKRGSKKALPVISYSYFNGDLIKMHKKHTAVLSIMMNRMMIKTVTYYFNNRERSESIDECFQKSYGAGYLEIEDEEMQNEYDALFPDNNTNGGKRYKYGKNSKRGF